MYTAENAPGVAVLLSGDADVPGPLTGLPTHQDNLDTVIGRYSRLIVVRARRGPGAGTDLGSLPAPTGSTSRWVMCRAGAAPRPGPTACRPGAGRRGAPGVASLGGCR